MAQFHERNIFFEQNFLHVTYTTSSGFLEIQPPNKMFRNFTLLSPKRLGLITSPLSC